MARAGLGWSIDRLAREAHVGVATVARFETGRGETIHATAAAMRHALETAGIEFLPDNGIRLKTATADSGRGQRLSDADGGTEQLPAARQTGSAPRSVEPIRNVAPT